MRLYRAWVLPLAPPVPEPFRKYTRYNSRLGGCSPHRLGGRETPALDAVRQLGAIGRKSAAGSQATKKCSRTSGKNSGVDCLAAPRAKTIQQSRGIRKN